MDFLTHLKESAGKSIRVAVPCLRCGQEGLGLSSPSEVQLLIGKQQLVIFAVKKRSGTLGSGDG
jgi:hypothetical protein